MIRLFLAAAVAGLIYYELEKKRRLRKMRDFLFGMIAGAITAAWLWFIFNTVMSF